MPLDPVSNPHIAVIGTGISGMSAAWLLAPHYRVTVFEAAPRIGGHSNTVTVNVGDKKVAVDTGFIVYNELTYPNLTALFQHLDVPNQATNMSFAASLRGGTMEYSGESISGIFAQKSNLINGRFWSMLYDLQRFYRHAPSSIDADSSNVVTLREYLRDNGYSEAFIQDHLLPLSAAIWSATPGDILDYPIEAFIQFHENHGLLKFFGRPVWRTVCGGSQVYVEKLTRGFSDNIVTNTQIRAVKRTADGAEIINSKGNKVCCDHVVFATHADQALALLEDPSPAERQLLSSFHYSQNIAHLHSDTSLMPKRKSVWSSWNFLGSENNADALVVSYWMNKLQDLQTKQNMFLTLNPRQLPREDMRYHVDDYEHPIIDSAAICAQRELWSIQGIMKTWFCGAYFGAGFHEDGLQAGLAVAEQLGGLRRPWQVENESGRIYVTSPAEPSRETMAA